MASGTDWRSGTTTAPPPVENPAGDYDPEYYEGGHQGVSAHQGSVARWLDPYDPLAPIAIRSRAVEPNRDSLRLGPLDKIYLIWMVGGSCDGCTVAVSGATHPRLEHLLSGILPGLPRVE